MPLIDGGKVLDFRQEPTAYLLYSRLLERELWIARDDRAAKEIAAEFPGVPVLTFAEVAPLKGKSVEWLQAVLDVKSAFAGARLRT